MTETKATAVPEITADTLRTMLAEGKPMHVLDVRAREQFDEWRIPGSRHVGGYEALKEGRDDVYAHRSLPDDGPLVMVCGAGKTSKRAVQQLRSQGKEAYSLQGGLRAWTFAWNVADTFFPDAHAEVVQVRRVGKGCLSYVVGSDNEALVIDPALAPSVYEAQAKRRGWTIVGVVDTHLHADHVSRARALAEATGATLYLPQQERVGYAYHPIQAGDVINVGRATLKALPTPGHTPESMTYELGGRAIFTGDTLFPWGVGRPDLDASPEEGRQKARRLFHSLQRLLRLSGDMMVLPGHTSRPVGFDEPVVGASIRDVREQLEILQLSEAQFVDEIVARVPPTPPNHEIIIDLNERGEWPDGEHLMALEAGANRCAVG